MPDETVISPDTDVNTGTTDAGPDAGDQGTRPTWREGLPEDLRDDPSLVKFENQEDVYRSYVNLQGLVGRKRALPADDAPKEDWDAFYGDLGRPETPESYELAKPSDIPKEYYREDLATDFRSWAHDAGLNQKQAGLIYSKYLEKSTAELKQGLVAIETFKKDSEAELKKEWGESYQVNLDLANRVIRECGDDKVRSSLEAGDPLWNNPNLARFLVKIGQSMSESSFVKGAGAQSGDIDSKLADLARNPALLDEKHPDHKATVAERDQLMKMKWDKK